ncbi:MAG: hypothetical protein H6741_18405 [Alphaproteobacteria bacterium]|nr:hypothetical protein [Alphaproteobacteria bacterium]MCB9794689.1 hypothetical protein [Alphaproteobacteria bacterium]
MNIATRNEGKLLRDRNRIVAQSFYRQLRHEGFTPEQVIDLSTTLLALVTEDIQSTEPAQAK